MLSDSGGRSSKSDGAMDQGKEHVWCALFRIKVYYFFFILKAHQNLIFLKEVEDPQTGPLYNTKELQVV